jgi:hypothetical protein
MARESRNPGIEVRSGFPHQPKADPSFGGFAFENDQNEERFSSLILTAGRR